ncbi:hypothetical protein NFC79_06100 [Providencia stuartii]|nr:hypothetical protein NFC79_06100 [Providencia stuartii]
MQGTEWIRHSNQAPADGDFILFISRDGIMLIGEYEACQLDENYHVWVNNEDGSHSVHYDDFELWTPAPPMPGEYYAGN